MMSWQVVMLKAPFHDMAKVPQPAGASLMAAFFWTVTLTGATVITFPTWYRSGRAFAQKPATCRSPRITVQKCMPDNGSTYA
jgi:hypothetical protein